MKKPESHQKIQALCDVVERARRGLFSAKITPLDFLDMYVIEMNIFSQHFTWWEKPADEN